MFELLLIELGERAALRPWNPAPGIWEECADWWFADPQEEELLIQSAWPMDHQFCQYCGKFGGH